MDYTSSFQQPSMIMRVAVGKAIGFVFGLIGFFLTPAIVPEISEMFRWGILLWYPTLGAVIGIFGVFTYHPVLHLPMPWWFRAPWVGAWFNLVLTLFAYDDMKIYMVALVGEDSVFSSPFWFVLEGAVIGLLIGFLATRYGGEGKGTVEDQPS